MQKPRSVSRARLGRALLALSCVALLLAGCGNASARRARTHATPTVHAMSTAHATTTPKPFLGPTPTQGTPTLPIGDPSLCTPGSTLAPLSATLATLYASTGNTVVALNASDGSQRWSRTDNAPGTNDFVAPDASGVYVNHFQPGGANAHITALGRADGAVRWQLPIANSLGDSSTEAKLAVADGAVYAAVTDGTLRALDGATGVPRWTAQIGVQQSFPSLTLASGVIFASYSHPSYLSGAGSSTVVVVAVRASDGTVLWQAQPNADSTLLMATNGLVYLAETPTTLAALDTATGTTRWQVDLPGSALSSAVEAGTGIYISGVQGGGPATYALNAMTGALCWVAASVFSTYVNAANAGAAASIPVLDGTLLYQTMFLYSPGPPDPGHDNLFALDARTGEQRWGAPVVGQTAVLTPASLVNDVLYLNGNPALAVRSADGATAWTDTEPSAYPNSSAIQVIGSTVYAAYNNGHVRALDAATGAVRWAIALPSVAVPGQYSLVAGA